MKVYMAVTTDKYELPIAFADTQKELAKILGVSANAIKKRVSRENSGKRVGYKCLCIDIEEDNKYEY